MAKKEMSEPKKVVVITGATSGIGEATAFFLQSKGYIVYSLARRVKESDIINYISCDVTKIETIKKALEEIYQKEKRIDVIINNAGMGISGAFEYTDAIDATKIMAVNLEGVLNIDKLVIPYLRETKGRIIHIGSVAGELAIPFQTYYSLTKAAIHMLNECLSLELKPFGIKLTCVMPGDTKTNFTANRVKDNNQAEYGTRIERSVKKMEQDEKNGVKPINVSKVIYKCLKKKNPPIKVAVGFIYKLFLFLKRLLPNKLINKILYSMYAK